MHLATMTLNPINPFEGIRNLHREMNRFFETSPAREAAGRYPLVNILSSAEKALVTAEIPGVDPADLEITLNKRQLNIVGSVKDDTPQTDGVVCHRRERSTGAFSRTILLPFEVEENAISAKYEKGVLEVQLPRAESSKPRKIAITTD